MRMMTPQEPQPAAALLRLPFDQYGRYSLIREALDATRPALGTRLRVLDVGGYFCTRRGESILPAREFLPGDDVTVIDREPCDLPGYVRGDGRKLEFAADAFDFVVSCDTLEHVPAADRPAFWAELLRVARYGVVLAAPFAGPEVVAAEALLLAYSRAELGVEQPQLVEHRDYGLPELTVTTALLNEWGLPHRVYPSGYVHAWLALMLAKHSHLFADYDLHEQLDAYYTRFFGPHERREPAYRHLLVVARDNSADWLAAVDAALAPTVQEAATTATPGWPEVATWLLQTLNLRREAAQTHALNVQAETIRHLQHELATRDAQIRDLEQRATWLAEQAAATRRALAAVENGLVLRLLRHLQRRGRRG